MICSIKAKDHDKDVKKVEQNWQPHVTQEVENLPLDCCYLKINKHNKNINSKEKTSLKS